MSHNLHALLTIAAEMRAVGHSWDAVAAKVQRRPRTCQNWTSRHRADWESLYHDAQTRRFHETSEEAHTLLKNLMRDDDKKVRYHAIALWVKSGAAAYGLTGAMKIPVSPKAIDSYIDNQIDGMRDVMHAFRKDVDARRARAGKPPATDEEFGEEFGEWMDMVNDSSLSEEPKPPPATTSTVVGGLLVLVLVAMVAARPNTDDLARGRPFAGAVDRASVLRQDAALDAQGRLLPGGPLLVREPADPRFRTDVTDNQIDSRATTNQLTVALRSSPRHNTLPANPPPSSETHMRSLSLSALLLSALCSYSAERNVVRSAKSGPWEAAATWADGKVPAAGDTVLIRTGHRVVYGSKEEKPFRAIHVSGTLEFDPDRETALPVGLLKIQPGENTTEEGFDCSAHIESPKEGEAKPALQVGTQASPIRKSALIRLHFFEGMNKESLPAIICCGGRMDFHGAPMNRTWLKLGADAKKGDSTVTLTDAVTGWKVGDKLIVTGTKDPDERRGVAFTEDATIQSIDGAKVTLDKALAFAHTGSGDYRGEVANLSRNVVIESADAANRGHTMYHRYSAGSISYAEFRHLGKEGVLGKYAIHFHLVGNTMRGSSVIGASVWDSGNRWVTIHGTNYLVVRDCVGYKSVGHGFFLEDGTEVYNVLDRNLAVQAKRGKRLPKQALPFDGNEGAGFWWANSLNTFTRNTSCESGLYGYRFEATRSSSFNLTLPIMQPDGTKKPTDIRTLPFVRFDDNEAHGDGLYGINIGEGVDRVGPDERHPFILRRTKIWELHYAFRPQSPCVMVEDMKMHNIAYGVYHPNYDRHVYKDMLIHHAGAEPFNRGHDDLSVQYGVLTVDGLTFSGHHYGGPTGMPLIQISDDNPTGNAESHFRNVKIIDNKGGERMALVNLGGGPRPTPKTPKGVPIYLHDWYGTGQHAKIASTKAKDLLSDGNTYGEEVGLTGDESRVAKVQNVAFPKLLNPVDDLPPASVITSVRKEGGKLLVRGTTGENGSIKRVVVNGVEAKATRENFAEWEAIVPMGAGVTAFAEDTAGNVETLKHEIEVQ